MTEPYTIDVLALLVLAILATVFALWQGYKLDKALRDADHPDHELAKEAVTSDPFDDHRFP